MQDIVKWSAEAAVHAWQSRQWIYGAIVVMEQWSLVNWLWSTGEPERWSSGYGPGLDESGKWQVASGVKEIIISTTRTRRKKRNKETG